jgi:hypothetical protein
MSHKGESDCRLVVAVLIRWLKEGNWPDMTTAILFPNTVEIVVVACNESMAVNRRCIL